MQECLKGRFLPLQVGERVGFGARSGCALFPVPWLESKKVFLTGVRILTLSKDEYTPILSSLLGHDGNGAPPQCRMVHSLTETKIVDKFKPELGLVCGIPYQHEVVEVW